jgi:hypothetical protein
VTSQNAKIHRPPERADVSALDAARLFERTLPASFGWVLEALAEIDRLKTAPGLSRAERREQAVALYAELSAGLGGLTEPTPSDQTRDSARFRRWFAEALLLWLRFAETGSQPLLDSVGSATLAAFPVDAPSDARAAEALKAALARAFGWEPGELDEVEQKVRRVTANLTLKRAIATALQAELSAGGFSAENRLAVMGDLYGPVPFRAEDVDVLLVSTAVFFFVPRKGSELSTASFGARPEAERAAVRAFFEKLDRANVAETRRFPSFGLCEPELVSSALVARLAKATGAAESAVKTTLMTMFSLIPKASHAQYLVHDLWGHTWQEALNEFEWEYALLPALDRPLSPADGPEFGGAGTPTLGSAFVARNGSTVLDEERLLAFGEADLRGRIQVATSVPLSEVLADFMESKFSRARPELELPTSSLIPSTSLKVDLTIVDTRTQVRRYTRPYRRLAVDAGEQARLAAELAASGLPEPGLLSSVARAGRRLFTAFAPAFDESLAPEPAQIEGSEIRATVLGRLLIQFALIMVDFEKALGTARAESVNGEGWRRPSSSPDLFAIAVTHFYEQDRRHHFWIIDQVARNELELACRRLDEELAAR